MTERTRRPTSADVARLSGVSRATVSYVLNETAGQRISTETRERVLAAVEELGYVSNRLARALKEGASRIVLLDLWGLPTGESLDRFLVGLDDELSRHGLVLLVHHGHTSSQPIADVAVDVAAFAVISARHLDERSTNALGQARITVAQSWYASGTMLPSPVRTQMQFLAAKGHRRILYAAPCQEVLADIAASRHEEACLAAEALDLEPPDRLNVDPDDIPRLASRLSDLRAGASAPTAVAAYNDDTALGVLSAMRSVGLSAPADLAVIGLDDVPHARLWVPALTTVRVGVEEGGRALAMSLIERSTMSTKLSIEIVERDST